MGKSVSVVMATDEQMQAFIAQPGTMHHSPILSPRAQDNCYLADHWDALHYLLTRGPLGAALPMGAIKHGEFEFRDEDPSHGITSATTKEFAAALSALSRADLEERYDPRDMRKNSVYPGRFWINADRAVGIDDETAAYFNRLRDFAARAAEAGKGLIFGRYEDW